MDGTTLLLRESLDHVIPLILHGGPVPTSRSWELGILRRRVRGIPVRMRRPAGNQDALAGTGVDLVAAHAEAEPPFQHVPGFVLLVMEMESGNRPISARVDACGPLDDDEVAAVVAFLASSDASYVTGAAIPVDGGWSVRGL